MTNNTVKEACNLLMTNQVTRIKKIYNFKQNSIYFF